MQRRKIGILGGSFDPVHFAHLDIADQACTSYGLDEVWLMPCQQQALKPRGAQASIEQRLDMLRLAIVDRPALKLCLFEVEQGGIAYTVETMRMLTTTSPEVSFYFIMGMDSVNGFSRWKEPDVLLTLCQFIVFDRPDVMPIPSPYTSILLKHRFSTFKSTISSTELRKIIAQNGEIGYYVPRAVEIYLCEHKLYREERNE